MKPEWRGWPTPETYLDPDWDDDEKWEVIYGDRDTRHLSSVGWVLVHLRRDSNTGVDE